jgi:hypothetical protein
VTVDGCPQGIGHFLRQPRTLLGAAAAADPDARELEALR